MPSATYFDQECPTCGRRLRVRVEYLGKWVKCQHCRARFEAWDQEGGTVPPFESSAAVMRRAEQLLATAGDRRSLPPR